jgi:hypothetical protein
VRLVPPVRLSTNYPAVGDVSPGSFTPPWDVVTPSTSSAVIPMMAVTTESYIVVVPSSLWSGLCPVFCVSVLLTGYALFQGIHVLALSGSITAAGASR